MCKLEIGNDIPISTILQIRKELIKKAEKLFAAEVSRNPFSLDALSGLGFAKTLQKDKAGATKYFQEALKVNATYGDALFGLEELKKL